MKAKQFLKSNAIWLVFIVEVIIFAVASVSCSLGARESAPTRRTISLRLASSWRMLMALLRFSMKPGKFFSYQGFR